MQSTQPMDRLLCGDVGYGKTEVAMRAAFKAASDNKQVVVLARTTVLAFQHFETFKQRFSAFPLTIEMISRFRSPKQQKEILEKVEAGKVDILIGTHRVLSKDIKFQDLGLVIVDEEQRFGVRHKERLKTLRKEVDVLTLSATTIIENGLDIPLCNTIIVNRADRHGLSELYQLRGRVGRSNRRAYAYLLIPAEAELTPIARRRLAALKEFSDLGAGFKIAALDLELRGAGNLLGGEQSGHIDAVGFELYTSMLDHAVRELRGEVAQDESEIQLNLGLNIRIPANYITEENQRLRIYKRIAGVETESHLSDVRGELQDRYGAAPAPVENLLQYAALKLLGLRIGVLAIDRKREQISIRFTGDASIDPGKMAEFVAG